MIHPGFFQCNVKTNLAREKDGEKHIMVERMYVLPGSITSFNYTAPEGKPRTPSLAPVTILPGYFYLLSSDGKYIFLTRLKPFFLQGGRGRIGERIVPTGES